MKNIFKKSFISLIVSLSFFVLPTLAVTITVDDLGDDVATGNGDTNCNLREAIYAAVTDTAVDSCVAGSGDDTVEFSAALVFPGTITLTKGELQLYGNNGNITITGPGSGMLTIDANSLSRVFTIGEEWGVDLIDVIISGVTVANGNSSNNAGGCMNLPANGGVGTKYTLHANDIIVRNCSSGTANGGGIAISQSGADAGELYLTNSRLESNTSGNFGAGIYGANDTVIDIRNSELKLNVSTSDGGGIYSSVGETVTILNSVIDSNVSNGSAGAGIASKSAITDIRSSSIINNQLNGGFCEGGGVFIGDNGLGNAALNEFVFIDNIVKGNSTTGGSCEGGGVYTRSGSGFISNNEISGNTTTSDGGGLKIYKGSVLVMNNTISANSAGRDGGGVKERGPDALVYLIHNTIRDNSAGRDGGGIISESILHFFHNIISQNTAVVAGQDLQSWDAAGMHISHGYNFIENLDSFPMTAVPGDNFGSTASPLTDGLSPLADNGGQSSPVNTPKTHAVSGGSSPFIYEYIPIATCNDVFNPANYGSGGSVVDTDTADFTATITALFTTIIPEDQRHFTRPSGVGCEVGAFELGAYDFGDAPDLYSTLSASTGAYHTIDPTLLLGVNVDNDNDGQPGVNANGDDLNGSTPDDEDGIVFPAITEGTMATIPVTVVNTTGVNAYIQAWIDFNNDGDFSDAGEQVATDLAANASGVINISVTPPAGSNGNRYARFRITQTNGLGSNGDGGIGEVEDYLITINAPIVIDLNLTKTVDNTAPTVGTNVVYTVTARNSGPSTATGVTVQDLLPACLTYVSDVPSQGLYNSVSGTWTVGTLLLAQTETLTITATANTTGVCSNVAQVSAAAETDTDSTPGNNVLSEDDQDSADITAASSGGGSGGGGGSGCGSGGGARITPDTGDGDNSSNSTPPATPKEEEQIKEELKEIVFEIIDLQREKNDLLFTKIFPKTGMISERLSQRYKAVSPFKDLDINNKYFEATVILYLQNIVEGYPDGTVKPNELINRVEVLKLLLTAKEVSLQADYGAKFPDTKEGEWYQPYLNYAYANKIVSGYENGDFGPEDNTSFAQIYKMAANIFGIDMSEKSGSNIHWGKAYMDALKSKNLIPEEFYNVEILDKKITRAEMFEIIYRIIIMKDSGSEEFIDHITMSIPSLNIKDIGVNRTVLSTSAIWLADLIDNVGFYEKLRTGKSSQIVIFGHSSKYVWDTNSYGTVFRPLIKGLNVGNSVKISYNGKLTEYEITKRELVQEDQIEYLNNDNSDLIIFTCDNNISMRWVFSAKKVDSVDYRF